MQVAKGLCDKHPSSAGRWGSTAGLWGGRAGQSQQVTTSAVPCKAKVTQVTVRNATFWVRVWQNRHHGEKDARAVVSLGGGQGPEREVQVAQRRAKKQPRDDKMCKSCAG